MGGVHVKVASPSPAIALTARGGNPLLRLTASVVDAPRPAASITVNVAE
jgi:hypothetical protein